MLYMYLLTAAACRARGLAAARSISRRSVRLRAGSTNTLDALREELDKNNVDAFVIPSDDPHLSEYVAPCFERRAFASGFTGSAGTAVVLKDRALCWTDGRYWLQASQQLGEGWFCGMGTPSRELNPPPTFLALSSPTLPAPFLPPAPSPTLARSTTPGLPRL